jgi:hypothetical protein
VGHGIRVLPDAARVTGCDDKAGKEVPTMTTLTHEPPRAGTSTGRRFEYRVIDTGKHVEAELNALGKDGWQVVGVTTKKQVMLAPPQAIILMREITPAG